MKYRIITALGLAAVSSVALTACPGTSSVPGSNLLDLINQRRAAVHCDPVSGDDQLRVAAERHAVDIRDHPEHFGPPGTDPPLADIHTGTDNTDGGARITAARYAPLVRWGEIIYWAGGPPGNTPQATVDWWMQSDGHRPHIENCAYTHAGIGLLYPGGTQWIAVVDFASH
ncbi:hypothetical protein F5X71_14490 [Nocardia brasiliensis]|uniref:SCP domain-containing protein n=1 Tax=Nocardia brasiliensis TaxID=37326 RepID=A0A6G9XR29_NOCBR|nr:CAP domain-containing protein [Nocardia brasiliensis]QIS03368.1 hypothetical protein F5X71_14490 [Nocardia brasiliensis]